MTLGLVLLTVSLILVADMIGVLPNKNKATLEARKKMSETLAIHIAKAAENNQVKVIQILLQQLVSRNDEILSISLVREGGKIVIQFGEHKKLWEKEYSDKTSTPSHIQVPILNGQKEWGKVQIRFTELSGSGLEGIIKSDFSLLLLFLAISGFFIFRMFLKRTLRFLDPSAAIPDRVREAMDIMTGAIIILDQKGQIIFANEAFPLLVDIPSSSLIGKKASELNWKFIKEKDSLAKKEVFPWDKTLANNEVVSEIPIGFITSKKVNKSLLANAAPVRSQEGKVRGVIVTFDDVTQIEKKNTQLNTMLDDLKTTQKELEGKNRELSELASQDPLTGCMNRRSFFNMTEEYLKEADIKNEDMACLMFDIDHFKSVNDNYGHGVGDRVIRDVAEAARSSLRDTDLLCRYGGEEFCLFLKKTNIFQAAGLAERIRTKISLLTFKDDKATRTLKVTVSVGASDFKQGMTKLKDVIDQADSALYKAKENGRNQVMRFGQDVNENTMSIENDLAAQVQPKKPNKLLQGFHDELTGLPGRILFVDSLKQMLFQKKKANNSDPVAVLIIDIDDFKRVNSSLGHAGGDILISEISKRVPSLIRRSDYSVSSSMNSTHNAKVTYSRLGGDEFGIVVQHFGTKNKLDSIIERMSKDLSAPYHVEGQDIHVTPSIGVTIFPSDGTSEDVLLKNAEVAMYHAKNSGGDNYVFYSDGISPENEESLKCENALHDAIKNNEFLLNYQPKVNLRSGKITGAEALIRWRNANNEVIPPGRFIAVAERTNLIIEIGNWVMREACIQAKKWALSGFKDIRISINLSPKQFVKHDFIETVKKIIFESGVNPRNLVFEVTENILMENIENIIPILKEFSDMGIHISVDDFGVGYSSLNYIKRFPLHEIKIDRSFVTNISQGNDDTAIVSAIIAMAHALKLKVIAEGVETPAQLQVLGNLGCNEIQGYLFSKPVESGKMSALLKSDTRLAIPGSGKNPSKDNVIQL